jgi:hypothetical protein
MSWGIKRKIQVANDMLPKIPDRASLVVKVCDKALRPKKAKAFMTAAGGITHK